ncbi:MAG: hypothetical protein IJY96_00475 [Oscillospiraceae bacterium]|nr:hypothetical protein [Oscillospiraceae bacterium]
MSKAWKVIGLIVLVLAVAGIVSAGIGMLTGASLDRMVENIFGGWETLELMLDVLAEELGGILPGEYGISVVTK